MDLEELALKEQIPNIIKRYKLLVKQDKLEEVTDALTFYIFNLIINICSLISTITLLYNKKNNKVEPAHVKMSLEYVQKECYTRQQQGGSYVIDSQYFGQESNNYQEFVSGTNTEMVDFNNQIARNALLVQQGGGKSYDSPIDEFRDILLREEREELFFGVNLRNLFSSYKVKLSDNTLLIVKKILKMHLNCYMYDLHHNYKRITRETIEKTANLQRHGVFT